MSVDLTTSYLGLQLANPLIVSASPLSGEVHMLERLVDAGAAAVVLPSLFEEQLETPELPLLERHGAGEGSMIRRVELDDYNAGADAYLRRVEIAKRSVPVPIIASLSLTHSGEWLQFARCVEEAGADALEINMYFVPVDPAVSGAEVEQRYVELVAAVRAQIRIPLALKLGPFFSSLPHLAQRLTGAGIDGLVLFNRYLEPDIDLDNLRVVSDLRLSTSDELCVPLRWIAILRRQVTVSLAGVTGVHTSADALKLIGAGAEAVMLASAILKHGPDRLTEILDGMRAWLESKSFASIAEFRGLFARTPGEASDAFERANYAHAVATYYEKHSP